MSTQPHLVEFRRLLNIGKNRRQDGMVLPVLMVVFVLIGVMVASLVQHMATADEDAIEEQLAHLRAYWAMSAVVDYSLSRASGTQYAPATTAIADSVKVADLTTFTGNSSVNSFVYIATVPSVVFQTSTTVSDLNTGNAADGFIQMRTSLDAQVAADVAPALRGLSNRVVDLVVDACIGSRSRAARTQSTADCESFTAFSATHGIATIHSYQRRPP